MKLLKSSTIAAVAIVVYSGMVSCKAKHEDAVSVENLTVNVSRPTVDSIVVTKEYPGELSPNKAIDVVARVNGVITAKTYTDGQFVKKGDILFRIEDTKYRDAVQQASAQLTTAEATADYATRQHAAMKKAYQSQAVSQMDVIKAESAMNEANASISNAKAALETARTNLGYCTVRALSDGHVAAPTALEGAYVSGEDSPFTLTTIYDDSTVSGNFAIEDSRYIALCQAEQDGLIDMNHIKVTFNDNVVAPMYGFLEYVAPDVNANTGTIKLRLKLPNPDGVLKSGMYVKIHLPVSSLPDAMLIKDAAISTDQRGKYVYTINDDNQVVYTPITVGELYQDSLRVVTSGLTRDDRYVTEALLKVKPGMKINPVVK